MTSRTRHLAAGRGMVTLVLRTHCNWKLNSNGICGCISTQLVLWLSLASIFCRVTGGPNPNCFICPSRDKEEKASYRSLFAPLGRCPPTHQVRMRPRNSRNTRVAQPQFGGLLAPCLYTNFKHMKLALRVINCQCIHRYRKYAPFTDLRLSIPQRQNAGNCQVDSTS